MPHPAINDLTSLSGSFRSWYRFPGGPWLPYWGPTSVIAATARYTRPASTSNPPGPTGRPVAPWSAKGGRSQAAYIEVQYQSANSGSVEYRWVGDYGAPLLASMLGVIPAVSSSIAADTMRETLAQFTENRVQLGAAAREAGDTFRMVGDAATGMAQGLDNLMNREWKKIGRMASWKKLPSAYLQYLYGWRTISDDISNAFDSLIQRLDDGCLFQLRGKKRAEDEVVIRDHQIFDGSVYMDLTFLIHQECRVVMNFQLPSWYWDNLPTVAPFGTLYETTRASFIVDWFIPIGSWIGAFESAQLWPFFTKGTISDKRERKLISARVTNRNNYYRMTQGAVGGSSTDYSYDRSVIEEMAEGIILARPSLRNPLSLSHAAQGLSLLTQVFRKWQ